MKKADPTPQADNILIVMADQLTAMTLGCYGDRQVKTPHIDRLAEQGVVFDAAYSSSPLCAPSRSAFMTGQHISQCGCYDNAAYLPSTTPTFAHYLRLLGYRTVLCGKMHFTGADQLHGFEQRLTADIYPPDFSWTPDWSKPHERMDDWYHNMSSVTQAGVAAITNQLAYDDEVGAQAVRALYEHARGTDPRPLCLVVGFIHPHDPYAARQRYWDLYQNVEIPLPTVPRLSPERQDAHSKRLEKVIGLDAVAIGEADIRRARRAYYANVSYIDAWLGKLQHVLEECDLAAQTATLFTSDHGDMLGERGLWYKMSFMEWANRIPLIISQPSRFGHRRVQQAVSHVDLLPTLLDLAVPDPASASAAVSSTAIARAAEIAPLSGRSLLPLCEPAAAQQPTDPDIAISEYLAEGASEPMLMIRQGRYKFISCAGDPELLFDLQTDPNELHNLAAPATSEPKNAPPHAAALQSLRQHAASHWDAAQIKQQVLDAQKRRRTVQAALQIGHQHHWDFVPTSSGAAGTERPENLTELDTLARYPRPPQFKPRS